MWNTCKIHVKIHAIYFHRVEPTLKNICISPASEQPLLAELDDTDEKDYKVQKILESKYEDDWL